jgi:pimeloyl-ACP methyl ester carboxylesterase
MNDTPHIVLVHGFWGGAAHWAKVIVELNHRGCDSLHAVENPLTSLADDAERTRQMVRQVDGPVLLVGHSYGGAVITEAGHLPNVVGLVYVAAFAPDAGESLGEIGAWNEAAAVANVAPDSDGHVWIRQDKFRESFCQDLSADEALVMAVTQKAPAGSTFANAASEPAWKQKPTWYQVSTDDRMIHPDSERRMAARMNARRTVELDASHASLASQPSAIVNLIDYAVADLSANAGDATTTRAASV